VSEGSSQERRQHEQDHVQDHEQDHRPSRRRPPCRNFGGDERSIELATRLVERGRELAALQRSFLADVAEFDAAEAWRGDGAVSMAAWLTERLGVGGATARMWTLTATRLEQLPQLAASLAAGQISLDLLAPLAEVATPESEAELASNAVDGGWSVKQARELAASHRGVTDAAEARRYEHRSFRCNDTNLTVWAALTKDDYAICKATLLAGVTWDEEAERKAAESAVAAGEDPIGYVPFHQRLYDSFMDLCREGRPTTKGHWYRPTMVVHANVGFLSDSEVPHDGAEIQGIGPISREVARRLACDAHVIFSVEGHDGCILDQKRAKRSPTVAQRREIARRDKGCRFPGCSFTDFTEVHHIWQWTDGGPTNQANLVTLCGRHHHAVHELGWMVDGNPDETLTFVGPRGHSMVSSPSPTWPIAARRAQAAKKPAPRAPLRR
jgi:uncharacterized protein DUF222/HNH endonuclease